jgi:hypothetical protein
MGLVLTFLSGKLQKQQSAYLKNRTLIRFSVQHAAIDRKPLDFKAQTVLHRTAFSMQQVQRLPLLRPSPRTMQHGFDP